MNGISTLRLQDSVACSTSIPPKWRPTRCT
jgi:hypothetical protein